MKKKLIIISGLTGVGKSNIAINLTNRLNGEIILGDSLQMYKNFPISANFPNAFLRKNIKYHLLGEEDVFTKRIIATDYREKVLKKIEDIHARNCVPIIEGGSGFYLYFLLKNNHNNYDDEIWNSALVSAKKIISESRNWDTCVEDLKKICPSYDNSIGKNDFYRLEKAFRYAIASKGEFFNSPEEKKETLDSVYDIRGYFIVMDSKNLKVNLEERCNEMFEAGLITEFLEFIIEFNKNKVVRNYSNFPIPIEIYFILKGYQECAEYINDLIDFDNNKFTYNTENLKTILQLTHKFLVKFQSKTRKYSVYQRKYFRHKFPNFLWLETSKHIQENNPILDKIFKNCICPREEYESLVNSASNSQLINQLPNPKETKYFHPKGIKQNETLIYHIVTKKILPSIQGMNKIANFIGGSFQKQCQFGMEQQVINQQYDQ